MRTRDSWHNTLADRRSTLCTMADKGLVARGQRRVGLRTQGTRHRTRPGRKSICCTKAGMVLHAQGPCDWRRVRRVVFSFFRPLGRIVGTPPPRTVPAVVAAALSKLCLYFAHTSRALQKSSVWNPLEPRVFGSPCFRRFDYDIAVSKTPVYLIRGGPGPRTCDQRASS